MALDESGSGTNVVSSFLQAWMSALAAREFDALADLFDDNALFTATGAEPRHGLAQIRDYYMNAPAGLRVQAELLLATQPLPGLVHGVAGVAFEAPGGVALRGLLGVSLVRRAQGWQVSAYQLSAATPEGAASARR